MTKLEENLLDQQAEMLAEFSSKQTVRVVDYEPFNVDKFVVPEYKGSNSKVIALDDLTSHEKRLIFAALYTANYVIFVLANGNSSNRQAMSSIAPMFMDYLNAQEINQFNRINILKHFETYRVEHFGVKTQSSGMVELLRLVNKALNYNPFGVNLLTTSDYQYLDLLSKNKPAAIDEPVQTTLTDYFGFHSWLRRDDIGVGTQLYNRAASPKLLMKSFQVTISCSLIEINKAKHTLIDVLRKKKVKPNFFPPKLIRPLQEDYKGGRKNKLFRSEEAAYKVATLKYIKDFFVKLKGLLEDEDNTNSINSAVESLLFSQCTESAFQFALKIFWDTGKIPSQTSKITGKPTTIFRQNSDSSFLFTPEFIQELVEYTNSQKSSIPISKGENYLFALLMSYQTVPLTDLFRIKLRDFRFSRRQTGEITQIESDYFKSRAKSYHEVETVTGSSLIGSAIIAFLNDRTDSFRNNEKLVDNDGSLQAKMGAMTNVSLFFKYLGGSCVRKEIGAQLSKQKTSSVFIDCVTAICSKGVRKEAYERNNSNWLLNCDTPTVTRIFSSQAVKNSRVHSESDNFDPTRITNYNSHKNETERKSYRTMENQTYLDNCGRITRSVMHDIELNVLRPSKAEIEEYNITIEGALKTIRYRAESTLALLKVVTKKKDGKVNELGFSLSSEDCEENLPDTINLVESPETVLKLLHYLAELERSHMKIFERSPEHLFFEALPTAEWIETVFSNRLFDRKTVTEGQNLYQKYRNDLPPIFTAYSGGY
ncbi:hypothetical protein L0668_19875 [Paraglaciecola aquimarina]|uniref:Uncharacterized protein n=1 Tax=Paraglaciecola algarum TaxID=3050085 RepID=A0ABS9DEE5_9ALTE|nr:hypothetical protein [Paraglaciecola sp. G1-23]MCF2950378.1 hypothetical protein [Paraglaciecola sp. G1-23]